MDEITPKKYSVKLGCLHSIVVIFIFIVAGILVGVTINSEPKALNKVMVTLIPFIGLIGMFISLFIQRRKYIIGGTLAFIICASLPVFLLFSSSKNEFSQTEIDLKIIGGKVINEGFGFSMPHPGDNFKLIPKLPVELQLLTAAQSNGRMWLLEDTLSGNFMIISVFKLVAEPDEKSFLDFVNVTTTPFNGLLSAVIEDTLIWNYENREYRFTGNIIDNAGFFIRRGLATDENCGKQFYVSVILITDELDRSLHITDGLIIKCAGS